MSICLDRCSYCGGNGRIRSNQGFFTVQQTCPQCNGNGEEITNPCNDCNGQGKKQASKRISVTIPKGVDDGTRIRPNSSSVINTFWNCYRYSF